MRIQNGVYDKEEEFPLPTLFTMEIDKYQIYDDIMTLKLKCQLNPPKNENEEEYNLEAHK